MKTSSSATTRNTSPSFSALRKWLLILPALAFATVGNALYADDNWDTDTVTSGAQAGSGTWTSSSANFWNGTSDINPPTTDPTDNIGFGSNATPYTVTISNGGTPLTYTHTSTGGNSVNINGNVTFAGDGLHLINYNINFNPGTTTTFSAAVDAGPAGTSATPTWNINNGAVVNLAGGGGFLPNIQQVTTSGTGTVNITGVYNSGTATPTWGSNRAGATIVFNQTAGGISGGFKLQNNDSSVNSATLSTYNLSGGTMTMSGDASIGGQSGSATSMSNSIFNLLTGGTVSDTGNHNFRIGVDGGQGTANFSGGTYNQTSGRITIAEGAPVSTLTATDVLNISGGTVTTPELRFSQGSNTFGVGSTATLNLTGGALYIGNSNGGLHATAETNLTETMNLGGGTFGATAATSSSMNMTLTGINGNVTIKAANAAGSAQNITLSGVLSGSGGFTKTGTGVLTFSGGSANTYSGNTLISAGVLTLSSGATLGTGNVEIGTSATLTLSLATSIASTANLVLDSSSTSALNMNYATFDTVNTLQVNSVFAAAGTYSSSALNTLFSTSEFQGTGGLIIAVPEPSTWAMMIGGFGFLIFFRSLRKKAESFI